MFEREEYFYENVGNATLRPSLSDKLRPETLIEHLRFLVEPTASKFFKHLVKDLKLGNLNAMDTFREERLNSLLMDCERLHLHKARDRFAEELFFNINLSSSKFGFERKLQVSNINKQEFSKPNKKKFGVI